MSDETSEPVFEIGLAMAGAISAGAYSGGVFDFLCEALTEWDRAKAGEIVDVDSDDVPRHNVCIKVMSGASAGALTGAVGLLALAKGVRPLTPDILPKNRYTLPSLYDAWVAKVDLASPPDSKNPDLLGLKDLEAVDPVTKKKLPLTSVLDASVLDWIAGEVMKAPPPKDAAPPPFNWLGKPLHLYMMVTNLRGIPYGIPFSSGGVIENHVMQSHGDRVHFTVTDMGSGGGENAFTGEDPVDGTFQLAAITPETGEAYISAGLASSAFPIALAPRKIKAFAKLYEKRQWPSLDERIDPAWPAGYALDAKTQLNYMAPDGGIIDNEPFEYAHRGIMTDAKTPNDRGANSANKAVIMIDPFPEAPDFDTVPDERPLSLASIPGKLISALKNQARFKPDEVRMALLPEIYSRFLIAPRMKDADRVSSAALATGLLGGFGGFLDRSFREYDYQLGRRNCQRFLQEYFTVGDHNPIAFDKAANKQLWPAKAYAEQRDDEKKEIRVIPLYGSAVPPVELLLRPRIGLKRVDTIRDRLKIRANAVISRIFSENVGSSLARAFLRVGWVAARGSVMDDTVQWMLLQGLIEADQLTELAATDENEKSKGDVARAVLVVAAALSDTAFDYYTRASLTALLAKKDLGRHFEGAIAVLDATAKKVPRFLVWKGAVGNFPDCFTWDALRPSWVMRQLSQAPKVNDPSTDAASAPKQPDGT
jgi:hypothetical protein